MPTYNPIITRTSTFNYYLRQIRQQKLLPLNKEERAQLVNKLKEEDSVALRQELAKHNLNYVIHLAKSQNYKHLDIMDLIQEGNYGLCEAMRDFDLNNNNEFTTFATSKVLRRIYEFVNDNKSIIPSDRNHEMLKKRYYDFLTYFFNTYGYFPTELEIEDQGKFSPLQIQNIKNYIVDICFLEDPIGDQENSTMADIIPDESQYEVTNKTLIIEAACNEYLSKRDKEILLSSYGIGRKYTTKEDLCQTYKLTMSKLNTIIKNAIKELQSHKKEIKQLFNKY